MDFILKIAQTITNEIIEELQMVKDIVGYYY